VISKPKLTDDQAFARLFPSRFAWAKADAAADAVPVHEPMHVHIDRWLAEYKRAGGRTRVST
jgi:hypothetical protein